MALSQRQVLKQTQKIELSKIMLMNLIQTPNEELRNAIEKEIENNPALEMESSGEETSFEQEITLDSLRNEENSESYDASDNWESEAIYHSPYNNESTTYERQIVTTFSFCDKLFMQLGEMKISERERQIAEYIVGNLEDNGYLLREIRALSFDLRLQYNLDVTEEEIEQVLINIVQTLEPTGIGARNLQECLLLQLQQQMQGGNNPDITVAYDVVKNHFPLLTKKEYGRIIKSEKITTTDWKRILGIIQKLVPYPGETVLTSQYAIPDFNLTIEDEELVLALTNEYKPKLRVSKEYEDLYEHYRKNRNQEALKFINENIEKAKSFITALPERDRTMYIVVNEIVNQQRDYFLSGDKKRLKPMVLKDIAGRVNMDLSTISRVTSRRYIQTPYGTILLKELFTEATNDEDGISSGVIKEVIKEMVDAEDKRHPLTDEKIAAQLVQRGYTISRRTVAKYREQLGIFATSLRKEK